MLVSCEKNKPEEPDGGVTPPPPPEYSVALKYGAYRLPVDDVRTFVATVSPEGTEVEWESSDPDIATVDENGIVTAIAEGTATITARTVEGEKEAACLVTVIEEALNCDTEMLPGWGESLGEVKFRTDKVWTVGTQQWSDAVVAEACGKQTFNSISDPDAQNSSDDYKELADCRNGVHNEHDYGTLFSWAAVYRFQSEICPDGWRVPTLDDFLLLDLNFGGTGEFGMSGRPGIYDQYYDPELWGGEAGGYCGFNGNWIHQEEFAMYWAQSQYGADWTKWAYTLNLYINTVSFGPSDKYIGGLVRCVRDV